MRERNFWKIDCCDEGHGIGIERCERPWLDHAGAHNHVDVDDRLLTASRRSANDAASLRGRCVSFEGRSVIASRKILQTWT